MFDENSALVKVWVKLINENQYTKDQIPNIQNLREIVLSLIGE